MSSKYDMEKNTSQEGDLDSLNDTLAFQDSLSLSEECTIPSSSNHGNGFSSNSFDETTLEKAIFRHPELIEKCFEIKDGKIVPKNRGDGALKPKSQSAKAGNSCSRNYPSSHTGSLPLCPTPRVEVKDDLQAEENDMFMELIRDVANELDVTTLCHKILVNVGRLTNSDRGSLFLAKGSKQNRYLVPKLFDVTVDSELDQSIQKPNDEGLRIPFGVGVAGFVAQTKQTINIKNAYEDPRFNKDIDKRTGYKTMSILSMPLCNHEGQVIGVAEMINKKNGSHEFTDEDERVFRKYLTFCGIGIQNAQLYEMSVNEYRRNQLLLNLARSIFQEQTNVDRLVAKILGEARDLLKCERFILYLKDTHCTSISDSASTEDLGEISPASIEDLHIEQDLRKILIYSNKTIEFDTAFELRPLEDSSIHHPTQNSLKTSLLAKIASYSAETGLVVNLTHLSNNNMSEHFEKEDVKVRSLLCLPIYNSSRQVSGATLLINKLNGLVFNETDINMFEAFTIFCGLGIHNTQLYENAYRLMAKQQVALECLSYHASAAPSDAEVLTKAQIPPVTIYDLKSYQFCDFDLSDEDTCKAVIRIFMDCQLISKFRIPYDILCRWILSVKKNYRPVKYHNWRHAMNVCQTMFTILTTGKMGQFMTDLEIFGLLVACLCHDVDHRGTNNAFQSKSESPLAVLYTTSTMEHHHFDQCIMILNSEGNNIFQALTTEDYIRVMKIVESAILSTDLAMYFKKRSQFIEMVEGGEFDWQELQKKELLCGMLMTACDVAAISKPWEVQKKIAKFVADEFFEQGDLEKLKLNQEPVAMMDRERKDELPKMQVGFIDAVCLPLYKALSDTFPWIQPLYDGCLSNRSNWQYLAEQVELGLTWINNDTIGGAIQENGKFEPEMVIFSQKHLGPPALNKDSIMNKSFNSEKRSIMGFVKKRRQSMPSSNTSDEHNPLVRSNRRSITSIDSSRDTSVVKPTDIAIQPSPELITEENQNQNVTPTVEKAKKYKKRRCAIS